MRPYGELDRSTAPYLTECVGAHARGHDHVVLDLRRVTLVDAGGVAALFAGDRRVRAVDAQLSVLGMDRPRSGVTGLSAWPAGDEERTREAGRTDRRLLAEFGALVAPTTVDRVVRGCRDDLRGAPPGALPELVERLARQRLHQALRPGADPAGATA